VSMVDLMRFLVATGDLSSTKTALVIQTGSPELFVKAVDLVRTALPSTTVTVLLQRNMAGKVSARAGVEYLENTGSKRALVRRLRERRFDAAFMLYFNQPGFWKLKILPFMIGARRVLAINENMDWFPISLRHATALARHLSWRAGQHTDHESALKSMAVGGVRAVAKVAVIAWLILYERFASLRADTSWKRENHIR